MRFSPQAIKASFLVENPGWYHYEITKVTSKPSEKGDSTNYFVVFEGRNGEMQDVPVTVLVNSKADWVALPIFTAANEGNKPEADKEYSFDDLKNIHMEAFTKRGTRQDGTPCNNLVEFRPLSK